MFLDTIQKMPAFDAEKPGGSTPDSTVVPRKCKSAIFRTHIKCGAHKELSHTIHISSCKWVFNFPVQIGWKKLGDTCIGCLFLSYNHLVRHLFFLCICSSAISLSRHHFQCLQLCLVSLTCVLFCCYPSQYKYTPPFHLSFVFTRSCVYTAILSQASYSFWLFFFFLLFMYTAFSVFAAVLDFVHSLFHLGPFDWGSKQPKHLSQIVIGS